MITFPNAKINIGLNIVSKRTDGFHDIETVFYPVEWQDALEVIESEEDQFSISGIEVPGDQRDNLCLKALQLLREDFGIPPVNICLYKNIPIGAGLGGGSSDGANMLRMLNTKFDLNLNTQSLKAYAAQLGSDCSFFVQNNVCFASGRGEVLKPVEIDLKSYHWVIIYPEMHISTAWAYSNIKPAKPVVSLKENIKLPVSKWKDCIFNDFEQPVFKKYPEIKQIKDTLYDKGAVFSLMSGSGSAVFGIFAYAPEIPGNLKKYQFWKSDV